MTVAELRSALAAYPDGALVYVTIEPQQLRLSAETVTPAPDSSPSDALYAYIGTTMGV